VFSQPQLLYTITINYAIDFNAMEEPQTQEWNAPPDSPASEASTQSWDSRNGPRPDSLDSSFDSLPSQDSGPSNAP
jgi:hypothetical protein